jgi:ABC-type Zn2+ transport system substrate-binding protein/surface adhesin
MALLRAAVTNEAAAERTREIFATQVAPALSTVAPDPAEAAVRSGLVASQILGAALVRYVLRLPPVATMHRAELVAWLGPTVQRYLTQHAHPQPPLDRRKAVEGARSSPAKPAD